MIEPISAYELERLASGTLEFGFDQVAALARELQAMRRKLEKQAELDALRLSLIEEMEASVRELGKCKNWRHVWKPDDPSCCDACAGTGWLPAVRQIIEKLAIVR